MKQSLRRLYSVVGMFILILGLGGCFGGQQQQSDDLENYEQGQQASGQEGNEYAEGGNESAEGEYGNQYEEGGNEYAESGNEYSNGSFDTDNMNLNSADGNAYASENYAAENDLQNIVSEMDNGGGNAYAEPNAAAPADDYSYANPGMATNAVPLNAAPVENVSTSGQGGMAMGMSGAPAAAGLPEMGSKMPYSVRAGDTLGKISTLLYGTPSRWREIATLSGLDNPNHIFPGDVLYFQLTPESLAYAQSAESVTRQETVVQPGDTLATIARRAYGSGRHWKSIWRQNDQIADPDQLVVGDVVYYVSDVSMADAKEIKPETNNLVFQDIQLEDNVDQTNNTNFEFAEVQLNTNTYNSVNLAALTTSAFSG